MLAIRSALCSTQAITLVERLRKNYMVSYAREPDTCIMEFTSYLISNTESDINVRGALLTLRARTILFPGGIVRHARGCGLLPRQPPREREGVAQVRTV